MIGRLLRAWRYRTPLGWRQLRHNRVRLAVATAGVGFANMLIFMQLGVMGALFETSVKPLRMFKADIVLLSPEARQIGAAGTLPRRRLYQALGVEGVESGAPLLVGALSFRSPGSVRQANVTVFALDPEFDGFADPVVSNQRFKLRVADTALLDRRTRRPFGAIAERIAAGEEPRAEVQGRTLTLVGVYALGASFDADGSAICSDQTYYRLFPGNTGASVGTILLRVNPGADVAAVAERLRGSLPASDTKVMTAPQYAAYIKSYMQSNTPIGYVFSFGVAIGLVIGFAIVYQILSADVADHIREYATFKAMGYSHGYLLGVVFEQAASLAALGFAPGLTLALALYRLLGAATELQVDMPLSRVALVLGLTFAMCCLSGAVATHRLLGVDPADVF